MQVVCDGCVVQLCDKPTMGLKEASGLARRRLNTVVPQDEPAPEHPYSPAPPHTSPSTTCMPAPPVHHLCVRHLHPSTCTPAHPSRAPTCFSISLFHSLTICSMSFPLSTEEGSEVVGAAAAAAGAEAAAVPAAVPAAPVAGADAAAVAAAEEAAGAAKEKLGVVEAAAALVAPAGMGSSSSSHGLARGCAVQQEEGCAVLR